MAFIRWKKNKFGIRQAYLIHSYRDEQGKPKHKTLAYLGREGDLKPEHLSLLKEKHKDVQVDWEKIQPTPHPASQIDIHQLNDDELLRHLAEIRIERGLNIRTFIGYINSLGAPPVSGNETLNTHLYSVFEKGWAMSRQESHYIHAGRLLGPYVRKALEL